MHQTVQLVGKLESRQPKKLAAVKDPLNVIATATAMSFPTGSGLIFLKDQISGKDFLVDTGASLSILPHKSTDPPSGPRLSGANGLPIPAWGFSQRTVEFGGKMYTFKFLLAAVAAPILGLDFLRKFRLDVSPVAHKIFNNGQPAPHAAVAAATRDPAAPAANPSNLTVTMRASPDFEVWTPVHPKAVVRCIETPTTSAAMASTLPHLDMTLQCPNQVRYSSSMPAYFHRSVSAGSVYTAHLDLPTRFANRQQPEQVSTAPA